MSLSRAFHFYLFFFFVSYTLSKALELKPVEATQCEFERSVLLRTTSEYLSNQWLITAIHESLLWDKRFEWVVDCARIIDIKAHPENSRRWITEWLKFKILHKELSSLNKNLWCQWIAFSIRTSSLFIADYNKILSARLVEIDQVYFSSELLFWARN